MDDGSVGPVNVFEPGQAITIEWTETINHPGHFRIAFDVDGMDDFYDPPTASTCDTAPPVLADCIDDLPGGGATSFDIVLPDVECENCILQVIQVMTDKPPYGDGNDIYYQCAKMALRYPGSSDAGVGQPDAGPGGPDASPADAGTPPVDVPGGCTGCTSNPQTTFGNGLLLCLLLVCLSGRSRARYR